MKIFILIRTRFLSAIDRVAKKTMTMDLTWDWPCGVAYYGLAEAYKATGKNRVHGIF